MHPRSSVSAISTYDWSLAEDLEFYGEAGITNVGVSMAKLDRFGWDEGITRVRDAGITVANMIGIGPFRLDDPAQWNGQRARLERAIDAAEALGAPSLVLTTGPAGRLSWEEAADALEQAIAPIVARARERGVAIALEHTNSLRVDVGFVHTLADVVDLARRLGTGVCMEINACWAERGLADTVASAVDLFGVVQVSDYAVGTMSTPARLVPGDGDVPIERILDQVLHAGYDGMFDLELIGPRIEEEGYAGAIRRSVDWLGDALTRLGQ